MNKKLACLLQLPFHIYLWVCCVLCVHICQDACVEVIGQPEGVSSVLLPSGTKRRKSCGQAWRQAPLLPAPFWWHTGDIFASLLSAQYPFSKILLGTTMDKRLESSLVMKDKIARSNYVPISFSCLQIHLFVRRKKPEILKHMDLKPQLYKFDGNVWVTVWSSDPCKEDTYFQEW